ncbi:unnamed protein product [Sphagnum balticum]
MRTRTPVGRIVSSISPSMNVGRRSVQSVSIEKDFTDFLEFSNHPVYVSLDDDKHGHGQQQARSTIIHRRQQRQERVSAIFGPDAEHGRRRQTDGQQYASTGFHLEIYF